jgi:hypothetical protein
MAASRALRSVEGATRVTFSGNFRPLHFSALRWGASKTRVTFVQFLGHRPGDADDGGAPQILANRRPVRPARAARQRRNEACHRRVAVAIERADSRAIFDLFIFSPSDEGASKKRVTYVGPSRGAAFYLAVAEALENDRHGTALSPTPSKTRVTFSEGHFLGLLSRRVTFTVLSNQGHLLG